MQLTMQILKWNGKKQQQLQQQLVLKEFGSIYNTILL